MDNLTKMQRHALQRWGKLVEGAEADYDRETLRQVADWAHGAAMVVEEGSAAEVAFTRFYKRCLRVRAELAGGGV